MKNELELPLATESLTIRDYFAGQALAGMLAGLSENADYSESIMATCAYRNADAMMKAREGNNG